MAGESPDRSEREKSSGETTEDAGSVPAARRQDPRELYAATGAAADESSPEGDSGGSGEGAEDAGDSGDARLRAAVAAWVSTSEADEAEETEEAEEAEDSDDHAGAATGTRDAAPGSPEPAKATTDSPTAMFGVRPEVAEPTDEQSAAARAERLTAAFFGSSRPSATKPVHEDDEDEGAGEEPAADVPSEDAESQAAPSDDDAPSDEPDEPDEPEDRKTAMFRAVAPEDGTSGTEGAAKKDHPTTAIRVPKHDEPEPKADPEPEAEPGAEDRGASRFVPLRSTDGPRTSRESSGRPLPDAVTTGTSTPPSTITGVGGEQERTKQQPVPEPPPLELLARLTNTPPPPETPIRTTVRRVKIWTPLVLLLAVVFVIAQAVRPLPEPTLTLTEQATYTFDGGAPTLPWPGEGQAYVEVSGLGVLGSYGEQKPVPIGSVAKTMTAYLVLQKSPLEEGEDGPEITIDQKAEDGGNRGAGNGNESVLPSVEKGDKISQRDALSALMIPSANNIARLLARWHSGSEAAFVEKMNEAADELGMENTTYTDPSGLKESTVSTAEDQVKLGKKVMELPALVAITKLPYWKDPFTGERMRNYNALVPFDGAIGIKTGTTTAAGGNLLFAGRKEVGGTQQLIVGAVLGQHKPPIIDTVNDVSRELLIAAGETLTSEKIVEKGDVVGYLDDGLGGRTPVVATEDVAAVGWGGVEVDLALEPAKTMPHAAPSGEKVGTLTVGGGPGQVEVPVALQEKLTEPAFGDKLTRIL